ncbi:hypothetical protein AKJ44_01425 [candidate division MSBL1 archaeon SCGC-AAA261F17]|uniref:Ribbon-helix-helix protein CopG domain-containing protein n=1 Tax=candidate division MSBL1 archaeon SCGC-AAA261F17 TaxID=1698274 RepID=A0A133V6L4_9EURY|nr:hypothetical protein AKJ44_01425 [candidate division MSBL1 archaeon SCGC-AAA261F17]
MVTTVQVHEDTLKRLKTLKKEFGAKSNEEVINLLLKKAKTPQKSHFGTLPKLEAFEREEIDRLS